MLDGTNTTDENEGRWQNEGKLGHRNKEIRDIEETREEAVHHGLLLKERIPPRRAQG